MGLDIEAGVGDGADGGIGIDRLNVEILGEVGGHDMPRVCGENLSGALETTGDERGADFLAVHTETKLRASEKRERDTHDGEPAIVIVKASLGELDFVGAIYIDDVFEMHDMIFSLFVDRNVAPLNATAQGFDNVTFFVDENGGMIPASEYFIRAPVTQHLAKANHAAGPAGAVGEDEIAGARVDHLLARPKVQNRSGMDRATNMC